MEVRVSTVDELLEAIAPNTTVILEAGTYDLSTASNYGGMSRDWYSWEQRYDGPSLLICGVSNFHLEGAGRGVTKILAMPRYATVLGFDHCENVSINGVTVGHTQEEAFCCGDVLDWIGCREIRIEDCGLFGCGVIGVYAENCRHIDVTDTEIYACSEGAASFYRCSDAVLEGCSIYGCRDGNNTIYVSGCKVLFDGETLGEGLHLFDRHDYLGLR